MAKECEWRKADGTREYRGLRSSPSRGVGGTALPPYRPPANSGWARVPPPSGQGPRSSVPQKLLEISLLWVSQDTLRSRSLEATNSPQKKKMHVYFITIKKKWYIWITFNNNVALCLLIWMDFCNKLLGEKQSFQ